MARRGTGRGTRMGKGVLSGSTVAFHPSGCTIDKQGIEYASGSVVSPTEIGYLDGQAGYGLSYPTTAGRKVTYGLTDFAGSGKPLEGTLSVSNVLSVDTGLTTTLGFWPSVYDASSDMHKLSASVHVTWQKNLTTTSEVTVCSFVVSGADVTPYMLFNKGVSLSWIAFGT